jgi:hypothetical protein
MANNSFSKSVKSVKSVVPTRFFVSLVTFCDHFLPEPFVTSVSPPLSMAPGVVNPKSTITKSARAMSTSRRSICAGWPAFPVNYQLSTINHQLSPPSPQMNAIPERSIKRNGSVSLRCRCVRSALRLCVNASRRTQALTGNPQVRNTECRDCSDLPVSAGPPFTFHVPPQHASATYITM